MPEVFISYSRKDVAFAHILVEALKLNQLETWIDWEDIPPSSDWRDEIHRAIEAADTFVYIVSQHSKDSQVCGEEVQHAIENNKRLVPIVIQPEIRPEELPARLAAVNWIFFPSAEGLSPQAGEFQQAFDKLLQAIRTDLDWAKAHTRLQVRALEWQKNQRESSFVLRGRELHEAEAWLAQAGDKKEPRPTELQRQYLLASRKDADRRQRFTLGAVATGLVIALVLAGVAFRQSQLASKNARVAEANAQAEAAARQTAVVESFIRATAEANAVSQRATAEAASTLAVQERDEAQRQAKLALAGKLAAQSQLLLKDQLDLALLLGVEASLVADTMEARLAPRLALEYSPRLRRMLVNNSAYLRHFAISPDGKTLALVVCTEVMETAFLPKCSQSRLEFFDAANGKPLGAATEGLPPAGYLAYNRLDGGQTLILVGYETISLWDIDGKQLAGVYPSGQKETRMFPTAAAFSADGRLLAIGSCGDRSQATDSNGYCNLGEVRLWDVAARQVVGQPVAAHEADVNALAFSADSQALASAGDGTIKIWRLPGTSGLAQAALDGEPIQALDSVTDALAFSPDGSLLAAGGSQNTITLWDVTTRQPTGAALMGHSYWVSALQFSPDGKTLASGSWDDSLILWDVASRQAVGKPLLGHNSDIQDLGFDVAGRGLVSIGLNGDVITWEPSSQFAGSPLGQMLPPGKGIFIWAQAFSPDGRILAYSADNTIYLWDVEKQQQVGEPLTGHPDAVRSLVFPPQDGGKTLVSADRAHVVISWDVASGEIKRQAGQDQLNALDYLSSFAKVDLSPDGSRLAVVGCSQKEGSNCLQSELWLQDTSTGEMTRQPLQIGAGVSFVRFSHNGALLAIASGKQAILWNVASQETLYLLEATERELDALAFSPDDRLLAVKGEAIVLWDLSSGLVIGEPVLDKTGSSGGESLAGTEDWGLAFSPDGRWLATVGNASGSLLLVDVATGQPYGSLLLDTRNQLMRGMMISVAFSPDGKVLVSGNNSGTVIQWNLDPANWQEMACATAGRSLTPQEWAAYMPAGAPYQPACP